MAKVFKRGSRRQAQGRSSGLVPLSDHGRIVPPAAGLALVSASVSAAGSAVAVWARATDAPAFAAVTTQPGWATFPDSRTSEDVGAVVAVHERAVARALMSIERLPIAHPTADLMPDGGVLLVGARAYWRPSAAERNGLLFDSDGQLVLEETLGDGIEHVQTTPTGDVWVAYFDEGVYGNYGWGSPGPDPIGARGILRFDRNLQLGWEFPSHEDQPWGAVSDCYALNVTEDAAWACYYTDFPIVRIQGGEVTSWLNDVGGAKALAVAGDRLALYGGYGDHGHRLVRGRLESGRFRVESEATLVMPDGSALPPGATVQGRGAHLHVIADDRWMILDPLN